MPRFLKGTTDHDKDGFMGGSNPGDDTMAKKHPVKAKTTAGNETPEAQTTKAEKKAAAEAQFAKADAVGDVRNAEDIEGEQIRAGLAVRGY